MLLVGAAACSNDGRTLAPTRPGQTTTTTVASSAPVTAPGVFSLSSADVGDGGVLPAQFTCTGTGTSPSLIWASTPAAEELALVVRDRNAEGYVHWIVTAIAPTATGFARGAVPGAAAPQVNSAGTTGWTAPCPPKGSGRHVYDFVLHVLPGPLKVDPAMPAPDLAARIEAASTHQARMAVSVTAAS